MGSDNAPRFSIVIPAFNAEATLHDALASLRAQTHAHWEAVVIDDGSIDRTREIAGQASRADSRVRVEAQPNAGESAARNRGVAVARGEWVVFLDADDWLLPTYLERMAAAIEADPAADVIHGGWVRVAFDGEQSPPMFAPSDRPLFPELARRNCLAIHACAVRRSLAANNPFDVTLRTCPDWDLWQRIARTGARFAAVPEALACYRLRPGSAGTAAVQLLTDALTLIARGHAPDPRVTSPAPAFAAGAAPEGAAGARLLFACWAAGLAIGQDQPAERLLDLVAGSRADISPDAVAEHLFGALPNPRGELATAWAYLWPRVAKPVDDFLRALEGLSSTPSLAARSRASLLEMILTRSVPFHVGARESEKRWKQAVAWHDAQRQLWQQRAEAAERNASRRVTPAKALILLYHRIDDLDADPWELAVSPSKFDEHLRVLDRIATVVPLAEAPQAIPGRQDTRPVVVVTFDDGYADNFRQALPVLERWKTPATMFICTAPIADQTEFWWDALERLLLTPGTLPSALRLPIGGAVLEWNLGASARYSREEMERNRGWRAWEAGPTSRHVLFASLWDELRRLPAAERTAVLGHLADWASGEDGDASARILPMTSAELLALSRSHLIEIGAHTMSHPALAALPLDEQSSEIAGSQTWLRDLLGRPVTSFSYPFGRTIDYSGRTVELVHQLGFSLACSNIPGRVDSGTDLYQLPRMQVKNWDGPMFEQQISAWLSD
jgi:peptidoglycan/xylan/chitin deacetylase (PgdA/CDA1 family)